MIEFEINLDRWCHVMHYKCSDAACGAVQSHCQALSLVTLCCLRVSDLCPDCHSGGKPEDQSPQVVTSVPSLTTGTSINIPVFAGAGKIFHYAYFCSDPEPLKIA